MATIKYSTVGQSNKEDVEAEKEDEAMLPLTASATSRAPSIANTQRESSMCWPGGLGRTVCSFKILVLTMVVFQNTAYALARRYSRGTLKDNYSTSSVLLVMEIAKLLLSAVQVVFSEEPSDVPSGSPLSKYCFLLRHGTTMMVPAAIYLIMNILGFLALTHIDAATFSIIAQMKVFTTAVFSVIVLGRSLAPRKWRALLTLTLGVVLISHEGLPKSSSNDDPTSQHQMSEYVLGIGASAGDVILSGFVSIYFEKVLKSVTETYSVWDRNFQLSFWSICIYTPIIFYDNPTDPFKGWTPMAAVCGAIGGLGGVLVALSIKHTDSIMKTIATTGAIVLTTVLNASFLQGPFTLPIAIGALIVIVSVCNYNDNGDAHI